MDSMGKTPGTGDATAPARGLIAIPARLASTRLQNKLMLKKTGKPLLSHVIEKAKQAARQSGGLLTGVLVACDHEDLFGVAEEWGATAIMTGSHHRCGTTRIAEAVQEVIGKRGREKVDFVVNVQGDEPELAPEAILRVAGELLDDPAAEMATLAVAMPAGTEVMKADPSAVKVVLDAEGRALYFSRSAIPHDRGPPPEEEPLWHHHLGIYAYRTEFLLRFGDLPPSPLEEREGLEQLRALSAGKAIRVGTVPAAWAGKGIDTLEDYDAFVHRYGT